MSPKYTLGGSPAEEGWGLSLGHGASTRHPRGALCTWGAIAGGKLMEQVRLQQGGFVTQGRVRGLRRQQQVLQERGQQLSRQRSKGGPRPSAVPARRRPRRPMLGCWGGARGNTLHKQCGTRSPGHQARSVPRVGLWRVQAGDALHLLGDHMLGEGIVPGQSLGHKLSEHTL